MVRLAVLLMQMQGIVLSEATAQLTSSRDGGVVIARKERDGDDWYLGAITDETGRELEIPLGFLETDIRFEATIYRDGDDAHWESKPYAYSIETLNVTNKNRLELRLAPGGGAAVRFRKL